MAKYKIVAHLEDTAYVFEYIDDLDLGIEKCKECWNKIHYTELPLDYIKSYELDEDSIFLEDCVYGETNGINSIYLTLISILR